MTICIEPRIMDVSQTSLMRAQSLGLPKCMIIRTEKDANIKARELKSKQLYAQRKVQRLKDANIEKFVVSFGTVEIREYPMILGFNPAVSQGPPVEIDWQHIDKIKYAFDSYEETRPDRKISVQMSMPQDMRIKILETNGESLRSIRKRIKEIKDLQRNRLETKETLFRRKTHERVEKFNRGLKNLFSMTRKKEERDLLRRTEHLSELPRDEDFEKYATEESSEFEELSPVLNFEFPLCNDADPMVNLSSDKNGALNHVI
jgi:hypothetical protein